MGRWVETSTYWHGDLLHIERRPFRGWCAEGDRALGEIVERIRVVAGEVRHLPGAEPDYAFLRVVALAAIVHAAFLMMVALTPRQPPKFLMEETVRDSKLRAGILAGGSHGEGWMAQRTIARPIEGAGTLPTRIVIPTPPGSRVRSGDNRGPFGEGALTMAVLGALVSKTDGASIFGDAVIADFHATAGELGIVGGIEGGVVGGVMGGSGEGYGTGHGTMGIGTIGTRSRCAALVERLVERVFKDEEQRRFADRMCRLASTRALDCLEQALSDDDVSAAKVASTCGEDLPPALTTRLRSE